MFFRFVGILWMIFGIWWMMKPQRLKRFFTKKVKKARRKMLLAVIILSCVLFFSAAKYAGGALGKAFLVFGLLGIIKAVFFATSKASEKILDWWLDRPLWMWRVWAGCFTLLGLFFQKI
ncbi:MAG: hypothetical protein ABIG92_00005 [Candidatus Omnitrophota bacterium]